MDMIRLFDNGVTIQRGKPVAAIAAQAGAKEKTIAAKILAAHDHPAQDAPRRSRTAIDGKRRTVTSSAARSTGRSIGSERFADSLK